MEIPLVLVMLAVEVGTLFECPPSLILAIAKVESTFDLYALGDRDAQRVPHSFGPWQLNDRGVGAGYSPEFLLNTPNAAYLTARELVRLCEVFECHFESIIAAWVLGESAVKEHGWETAKTYVEQVLAAREEYLILDQVVTYPSRFP